MAQELLGIHHVTAFCSDPQKNIDFYTGVLGLRLVKVTVNFDDPGTYHFYYGDGVGTPGSILTFFAWPLARRGRIGTPQVTATAFAVPAGSFPFWERRLAEAGVNAAPRKRRFDRDVLPFEDPDGLRLELVESDAPAAAPWLGSPVAPDRAIRSIGGVTLAVEASEHTVSLLNETMHFPLLAADGAAARFAAGTGGAFVDVECRPDAPHGTTGVGVVHHVAWRVADDAAQAQWRQTLIRAGRNVTPVMDRNYFRSVYFREPGGVLFEIATDAPGFTADESEAELGTKLKLPPQYEPARQALEGLLPKVRLPGPADGGAA